MTTGDPRSGDVIAFVVRHMACQACGASYTADKICVALDDGVQQILIATCPSCGTAQQITAYDEPPYHLLYPADPVIVSGITPEEVSAWRAFLDVFEGDIEDLFLAG